MGNLMFNIRFGVYHLRIEEKFPYKMEWLKNQHHVKNKPDKWFMLYSIGNKHFH